jgi:hypothetical protein
MHVFRLKLKRSQKLSYSNRLQQITVNNLAIMGKISHCNVKHLLCLGQLSDVVQDDHRPKFLQYQ